MGGRYPVVILFNAFIINYKIRNYDYCTFKRRRKYRESLKEIQEKIRKTGIVKELRDRQAFTKPSVRNRAQRIKAAYKQSLQQAEE